MPESTVRPIYVGEKPCWWCGSEYVLHIYHNDILAWETQCSVCGVYHGHNESRGYQGYPGQGYTGYEGRVIEDEPGLQGYRGYQGYTGYEGPIRGFEGPAVSMETRYVTPTPAPENIELTLDARLGRSFASARAVANFTDALRAQLEMMERL